MRAFHRISGLFTTMILVVVLLASCSKEDLVEPGCGGVDQTNAKSNTATIVNPHGTPANSASTQGIGNPKAEGVGISDDGDDLSDSERSRKKARN